MSTLVTVFILSFAAAHTYILCLRSFFCVLLYLMLVLRTDQPPPMPQRHLLPLPSVIKGQFQHDEKNQMRPHDGHQQRSGLVPCRITAQQGCRHVADHQQPTGTSRRQQTHPNPCMDGYQTQECCGQINHHGVPVQTNPVHHEHGLHSHTLREDPKEDRSTKREGEAHRHGPN